MRPCEGLVDTEALVLDGYFLKGVSGETVLVFRSDDPEALLLIIQKLCKTRHKEIKGVATTLETEWYAEEAKGKNANVRRVHGETRPQGRQSSKDGRGH